MSSVRVENRKALLYLLNDNGSMSRSDIAHEMGLTPAAVTKITSELIEDGIIRETGSDDSIPSAAGRKKVLLVLNTEKKYILCINTETETTDISVAALDKTLVASCRINNPSEDSEHLALTVKKSKELIAESGISENEFIGCCVCVVGAINSDGVTVGQFGIWHEKTDVRGYFEKAFNMKTVTANNVKAFASAELLYGKGREVDNMLFLKWSHGIGSAVVIHGRVYDSNGASAEIGHFIVNPNGKKCRCGRWGCLETETDYENPENSVARVAFSLANSSVIINPQKIILFGSIFEDKKLLHSFIDAYRNFSSDVSEDFIELSELNDKRNYIGPLAAGADKLFFDYGKERLTIKSQAPKRKFCKKVCRP